MRFGLGPGCRGRPGCRPAMALTCDSEAVRPSELTQVGGCHRQKRFEPHVVVFVLCEMGSIQNLGDEWSPVWKKQVDFPGRSVLREMRIVQNLSGLSIETPENNQESPSIEPRPKRVVICYVVLFCLRH